MRPIPKHKGEQGQTIALLALSIVVLLAFAAFAIDTGVLYTARTSAQTAADAAALAGVFTFMNPCTSATPPAGCGAGVTPQPTAAKNAAVAVAAKNSIMGQSVNLGDTFTDCTTLPTSFSAGSQGAVCVDQANKRVTVAVARQGANGIATFFARAILWNRVNISAHATAEAGPGGTGSRCLKPVFLPNTILSTLDPVAACTAGQIIFDPANADHLTSWAQAQVGKCVNMRPTQASDKNKLPAPGQFYSLDFGSGGSTYRCAWQNCLSTPSCNTDISLVQCEHLYPLETGDMVGPLKQGVNGLIGANPDTWIGIGQYQTSAGVSASSKSLITASIWDNCGQTISSGTNGQQVKVLGFVEMFIDQMTNQPVAGCLGAQTGTGGGSGAWVEAHMVNQIQCALAAGGGGGPTTTGPLGVPIRLVQTP